MTLTPDNTTAQLMLFLFSTTKKLNILLAKQTLYKVTIRWMPKGNATIPPIIKALDPQKAVYVPRHTFSNFKQSVNIQNKILDNTTEHTMYVDTMPSNDK